MKKFFRIFLSLFFIFISFIAFSCISFPSQSKSNCSIYIDDVGVKKEFQLVRYFLANNPNADVNKVRRLANYYILECKYEGVNSDIAFVQMCHETGFLTFGNLVTVEMNNFCGLGAIDKNNRGLSFKTEQLGVRAHVQHLQAYGTTRNLRGKCIDPRYKYVQPRGKAPTVAELAGTWAADKEYGNKLKAKLIQLSLY